MFETLERLDRILLLKINSLHTPLMDTCMWYLSQTWPTVVLLLLAALLIHKKYALRKAAEFLLGCALVVACTDLSANFIKHNVKRYRPTHNLEIKQQVLILNNYSGGQYSFPSGHAANTFGVCTFIFLCLHWVKQRYRLLIYIYPFLVVYSRIYIGVHYPTDIIMGLFIGLFFGWLGYKVVNRHFLKFDAPVV